MPNDLSNFLWAFKHKMLSTHSAPFDFDSQQDVAEILQVVFDELKGTSMATEDLRSNTLRTTVACNSCFCSAVREEKQDIVSIPIAADNIHISLEEFISCELLTLENEWFSPSCISVRKKSKILLLFNLHLSW